MWLREKYDKRVIQASQVPKAAAAFGIVHKPLVEGAPGHMEGHNVIAALAVGAAHAVKQATVQFKIPGTVEVSIGPAEEQLVSRPSLVRDGYFRDVDAAIITQVADNLATGYGLQNYALIGAKPPVDLNREMMEKYRPAMQN